MLTVVVFIICRFEKNRNMKTFKNDWILIVLLRHMKEKGFFYKRFLKCLERSYPSFEENQEIISYLSDNKYIDDISGYRYVYNANDGSWSERPEDLPPVYETTLIGKKAIFSSELPSEKIEKFLDKGLVRWGAIIGGCYSVYMVAVDLFSYLMDNFF